METQWKDVEHDAMHAQDPQALVEDVASDGPTLSRPILAHAALVGIAGNFLLRDGFGGVATPLWMAIVVLALIALAWRDRRRITAEGSAWLASAVCFACFIAWRDSETLQLLDTVAILGSLAMAAISLGAPQASLAAPRLRNTAWALAALARAILGGVLTLAFREVFEPQLRGRVSSRLVPLVRAAAIAGALVVVFGALLNDADPIFASLISLPDIDGGLIVSHVVVMAFYAWLFGGLARGALTTDLQRYHAPDRLPVRLDMLDVTATLGALNVLFGAFVLTQLGWFFGGERFLQARTGLTAAAYARTGFFQMLWVVILVVPLILATRAALRPGRELARRHATLSLLLLALLGGIVISAVLRMKLYVHYYGLTIDRLDPLVFMAWVVIVLAWLSATVLRDEGRLFVAGAVISGLTVLAAMNVMSSDAFVAQFNVARASSAEAPLDLRHMSGLSGEAVPTLVRATLAPSRGSPGSKVHDDDEQQRCNAAFRLLERWGPGSRSALRRADDASWRTWNAGEALALSVVAANARAIRNTMHRACGGPYSAWGGYGDSS